MWLIHPGWGSVGLPARALLVGDHPFDPATGKATRGDAESSWDGGWAKRQIPAELGAEDTPLPRSKPMMEPGLQV